MEKWLFQVSNSHDIVLPLPQQRLHVQSKIKVFKFLVKLL